MINFELEDRTLKFSKDVVAISKRLPQDKNTLSLTNQLVRSATSIGANYREANGSSSKKDFKNKIHICKKEARETKYWLEILKDLAPTESGLINRLIDEAHQYILIFGKITSTLSKNK